MQKRQFLAATGSIVGVGVGGYGLYTNGGQRVIGQIGEAEDTDSSTDAVGETRSGALLSGMSPKSFSTDHFAALQEWLGTQQAVSVFFSDMALSDAEISEKIDFCEYLWNQGYVPHMFWQPNFGASNDEKQAVTRAVTDGEYDTRLESWATAIDDWLRRPAGEPDRRLYISLGPEFNGQWVPWGIPTEETTPESYVGMWERIHDMVMNKGVTGDHLQWLWTANSTSTGTVDISQSYPGDEYVDWLGVTGYNWENWGSWKSPSDVFDTMIETVREISSRPLAVSEFGCSSECSTGHCPERKDEWIHDAYDYMDAHDIKLACWFDHDKKTDWDVFGSAYGTEESSHNGETYRAYRGYREVISRDEVLSTHPNDERHLTSAEFRGEF